VRLAGLDLLDVRRLDGERDSELLEDGSPLGRGRRQD
jgi:hypothetical protein